MSITCLSRLGHLYSLGGGLVQSVEGVDLEARLLDHPAGSVLESSTSRVQYSLLRLSFLGSLQTNNEGDLKLQLLGGLDDTLGNDVASHDTTDYC
jgi:hypothetical protein